MCNESYRSELIRIVTLDLSALANKTMLEIRTIKATLKYSQLLSEEKLFETRVRLRFLKKLRAIQLKELKSRQMKLF